MISMSSGFVIPTPCSKRWTDLHGDGRQRYCDACGNNVYAIEEYRPEEWERIWRESEGRACGFLAGETPAEPRTRRAMLAGVLLTAISPLLAQSGRVRIRVTDASGAVIQGAEVSLLGVDDKPMRTERTNAAGEVAWTTLPLGNCHFLVDMTGFERPRLTVTLHNGDEVKVDAILQLGSVGGPFEIPLHRQQPGSGSARPSEPKPAKRRRWWIFR
jgi:hypothetical protein